MKYLHFVESFSTGVFSWILDIATHQAKEGHAVTIVYSLREETPKNFHELLPSSVHTVQLQMKREIAPFSDLKSTYHFAKILKNLQPDVVHLHSSKAGVIGRIGRLLTRSTMPIFYTPHGLSYLRQDVSPFKRWGFQAIENVISYLPGHILACSKSEHEALSKLVPKHKLSRLDNAIDSELLLRHIKEVKHENKHITVCTSGGIRYQKAPLLFAEIASIIGDRVEDTSVSWLWIGDENDEQHTYTQALEKAGVSITGWRPREQGLEMLSQCDIYLQTSLWEGLPLSVLEAQALRLPVVVSQCAGNKDAMVDGHTGFVAYDINDFVSTLKHLITHPEVRLSLGNNAKTWAHDQHSLNELFSKLGAIYSEALEPSEPLKE